MYGKNCGVSYFIERFIYGNYIPGYDRTIFNWFFSHSVASIDDSFRKQMMVRGFENAVVIELWDIAHGETAAMQTNNNSTLSISGIHHQGIHWIRWSLFPAIQNLV